MPFSELIAEMWPAATPRPLSDTDVYVIETMLDVGATVEEIAGAFDYAQDQVMAVVAAASENVSGSPSRIPIRA